MTPPRLFCIPATAAPTSDVGEPDVGDVTPCLARYGLRLSRPSQFAVERRRGWVETPDTPPADPDDAWDERRSVRMSKAQPGGSLRLEVQGSYAAFRDIPHLSEPALYALVRDGVGKPLEAVQWADWDDGGRLLVASADGRLRMCEVAGARQRRAAGFDTDVRRTLRVVQEHDVASLRPEPEKAPVWALEW